MQTFSLYNGHKNITDTHILAFKQLLESAAYLLDHVRGGG